MDKRKRLSTFLEEAREKSNTYRQSEGEKRKKCDNDRTSDDWSDCDTPTVAHGGLSEYISVIKQTSSPSQESEIQSGYDTPTGIVTTPTGHVTDVDSIESGSPDNTPLESVDTNSRASDWLKHINSPTSTSADNWNMALCSSSSKKRMRRQSLRPAYVREGLAEHVSRLLEREHSSVSFWSHDNTPCDGVHVIVRVRHAMFYCSLLISSVSILSSNDPQCEGAMGNTPVLVYFSNECAKRLSINVQSVLYIAWPWRSVNVPINGVSTLILFSTHYCSILQERLNELKECVDEYKPTNGSIIPAGSLINALDVTQYNNVCLNITIKAIYHRKSRWTLLASDKCGLYLELMIQEKHVSIWSDVIINGLVSRKYEVIGCQFVERMDRNDSNDKLFTLMESLPTEAESELLSVRCDMCYYVLHTRDSSYWRKKEGTCMGRAQQQRKLGMRRRINLSARLLYQDDEGMYAVVMETDRPHVARISIGTSVVMSTVSPGDVCTLSNILIHTHAGTVSYSLDSYSLIIPQAPSPKPHPLLSVPQCTTTALSSFTVPLLSRETMVVNHIVSITGSVIEVDERNAFVWLTCCNCSQCLDTTMKVCGGCGQNISGCGQDTTVCVQVSVLLAITDYPNWRITVELTNATARQLLPISTECISRGLNVEPLINTLVSLDYCIVTSVRETGTHSSEVELKQLY